MLGGKEDGVVLVERGLKSEECFESKNASFENGYGVLEDSCFPE